MSDVSEKSYNGGEWTHDEWADAWSIKVGEAYGCDKCKTMIMVTKGGVGTLEPKCCGVSMVHVKPQ